ncbi:2-acylglycerol O-acyltransferase 2-A-like [Python bivittatus]|uniref:Acyltransferase n=1 Tax=Python bivittatus TaxID=176946 RepID=A0A9F2WHB6_PYTBI|nr:2-acylglycerol O-acyltransferase 2-A-like [Python bivittatus]
MKVEFAPRRIPLQRRLQTASVLQWVFSSLCLAQCCIAIFVFLLFTRFWLISAVYAVWWALDWDTPNKGGRRFRCVRNSIVWRYMKDYFPITLVKTAELDPAKNYIFGFHPHGILVAGAFVNFCTEATGFSKLFPGLTSHMMMLNLWFRAPFFRDYLMSGGKQTQKGSLMNWESSEGGRDGDLLKASPNPEGAGDPLGRLTNVALAKWFLLEKNLKGFVRLAIEHGTALVPVFSFGENELFDQVENPKGSWLRWTQQHLQKIMGISLPLFHARGIFQYTFGFMPYRRPIYTVVGKPIQVKKKHNPSQEEVDLLHSRYLEELCKLFEEHKLKYNVPEDMHLTFI